MLARSYIVGILTYSRSIFYSISHDSRRVCNCHVIGSHGNLLCRTYDIVFPIINLNIKSIFQLSEHHEFRIYHKLVSPQT